MPSVSVFSKPCPDFFEAFGGVPVFSFVVMRNAQFDPRENLFEMADIAGAVDAVMMATELRHLLENGDRSSFPAMPQDGSKIIVVVDWREVGNTGDFYWAINQFMPIGEPPANIQAIHVLPEIFGNISLKEWHQWGTGFPEDISHLVNTPLWTCVS